jgi:hypothetical protein
MNFSLQVLAGFKAAYVARVYALLFSLVLANLCNGYFGVYVSRNRRFSIINAQNILEGIKHVNIIHICKNFKLQFKYTISILLFNTRHDQT